MLQRAIFLIAFLAVPAMLNANSNCSVFGGIPQNPQGIEEQRTVVQLIRPVSLDSLWATVSYAIGRICRQIRKSEINQPNHAGYPLVPETFHRSYYAFQTRWFPIQKFYDSYIIIDSTRSSLCITSYRITPTGRPVGCARTISHRIAHEILRSLPGARIECCIEFKPTQFHLGAHGGKMSYRDEK
jgi:hypothetical protein